MKKRAAISILFLLTLTGSSLPLLAQEGSRGGTFLPLGWDARGDGLAGAAALLVRNDGAAYWNPANLVFLRTPRATLGTLKPVPDMDNRYSILSIGTGFLDTRESDPEGPQFKRFGAAFTMTHLGLDLAAGSGWNESTVGLSAAFSPNNYNSVGLSWRFLRSWTDLEEANSWGMALDLGWTARLRQNIWFALVARNMYSAIHYPRRDEEIDPSLIFALSWENILKRSSAECDFVYREGELNRFLAGAELMVARDLLYILGGLDMRLVNGQRTIPHLGISTMYRGADISLSFSFDPEDVFGRQTRISISYQL
ncbi:MAG: hypothetical protein JXB45_03285 [Candidatus Krumholzibacteriota bacterium]|nr:hypothetical protein [Candidatus Krumholzibacteriota bacterium]